MKSDMKIEVQVNSNKLEKQFELIKEIGSKCVIAIGTMNAALFVSMLSNYGIHDKYANVALLLFGLGTFTSLLIGVKVFDLFWQYYEGNLQLSGDGDSKKRLEYYRRIEILTMISLLAPVAGVISFLIYSNATCEGNYLLAVNILVFMMVLMWIVLNISDYGPQNLWNRIKQIGNNIIRTKKKYFIIIIIAGLCSYQIVELCNSHFILDAANKILKLSQFLWEKILEII